MLKLGTWLLFLVTTASFAATVVANRSEERNRDRAAALGRPDARFLQLTQTVVSAAE